MFTTCSGRYNEAAMIIMEMKRKRNESVGKGNGQSLFNYCQGNRSMKSNRDHIMENQGASKIQEKREGILNMNFSVGVSM